MTVPVQIPIIRSVASGASATFTYDYLVLEKGDMTVTVDDVPVAQDNFQITGLGEDNGGTVTVLTGNPAAGAVVVLERVIPLERDTDYQQSGEFRSPTVNNDFDRIWMALQGISYLVGGGNAALSRALMLGPSDVNGTGSYRANLNRIQDLADPVNGMDAVNLQTLLEKIGEFASDGTGQAVLDLLSDTTSPANGDARVAVKQSFAGATSTTQHELNAQRFSVFNAMTPAQIADVLAGTWSVDVTAAINVAISAAAVLGKRLLIPAGLYKVKPASTMTDEAGSNLCAFPMASNMHIDAEPGAIFKIADNVSTDAAPVRISMFFSNQVLHDISFRNLTLDMNGANNKMSPQRASLIYNRFTQAHIIFSGTPGGVAARGDNVLIDNCKFLNTPGVSSIVMCQSNSQNVTISKNWTITNCLFKNNGLDTDDHSSVFSWADTVYAAGNYFTADTMQGTVGHTGGQVAFEIAGPHQRFIANRVENYFQGNWIAPNYTVDTHDVVVALNVYSKIKFCAVDVYRIVANSTNIHGITITGNMVYMDDTVSPALTEPTFKTPFQCATPYAVRDIRITNNYAEKTGTARPSAFMNIAAQTTAAGQKHGHFEIRGNRGVGFTMGVNISTNAVNGLGEVTIKDNAFVDLNPSSGYVAAGVISAGAGIVDLLDIAGNSFIETRPSYQFQYGINLSGAITMLHVDGNTYNNMTVADYYESNLTVANRRGRFNKLGFTPTWFSNSAITLGNGSVAGMYSINEKTVHYTAMLNVGSSTTFPGGILAVSLPTNAAADAAGLTFLGAYRIKDASAGIWRTGVAYVDGNTNLAYMQPDNTSQATNAAPVPLAVGDRIELQLSYPIS